MYEVIAANYERLFPLDPARLELVEHLGGGQGSGPEACIGSRESHPLLDIGSATGEFVFALAGAGYPAVGWEPDPTLLARALELRTRLPAGTAGLARFEPKGMLDLDVTAIYGQIWCMGNTLPHLAGPSELEAFFGKARQALRPGGSLVLQCLNFARLLDKEEHHFPLVQTGTLAFERWYSGITPERLLFHIRLSDSATGLSRSAETPLYPATMETIRALLLATGFGQVRVCSSYSLAAATGREPHLLFVAQAPA